MTYSSVYFQAVQMDSPESIEMKLDTDFDEMLVEMKPHVLRLPHKSGMFLAYSLTNNSMLVHNNWICHVIGSNTKYRIPSTVYTRIFAERKTQNINAEIVGSVYTHITIITYNIYKKITILTLI